MDQVPEFMKVFAQKGAGYTPQDLQAFEKAASDDNYQVFLGYTTSFVLPFVGGWRGFFGDLYENSQKVGWFKFNAYATGLGIDLLPQKFAFGAYKKNLVGTERGITLIGHSLPFASFYWDVGKQLYVAAVGIGGGCTPIEANIGMAYSGLYAASPMMAMESVGNKPGFLKTGPVGGSGGDSFSVDDYSVAYPISRINIRSGTEVDSIQLVYGNSFSGAYHGGNGGMPTQVVLADNEYITDVFGSAGTRVDQINFRTNLGNSFGPYGGNGGAPFHFKGDGLALRGVTGRSGEKIDQLTFIWSSIIS